MSSPIRSHLTVLENSAATYGSLPAFRLPTLESTGAVRDWQTVTYRQFFADVERVARYWHHRLVATGLPHRSVVGVWLSGMTYDDVLHTYAIARAGFIPQMFSLRLPNPDVIYALMRQANASALIYDTSNASSMASAPVPTFPAVASSAIPTSTDELPSITANLTGTDTWCIFHTSGSTSGMPKVIRCSYNWLDKIITKANFLCRRRNSARQDVTTWVGSMSHIAQTFMLIGALHNGSAIIQPTRPAFGSDEFVDMVNRCQLNCLRQFGTFLAIHLRAARRSPEVLAALRSLDEAFFCGIGLLPEDEEFAMSNNINIRNIFGSTEVGAMLYTADGERFLRQLPGTNYGFWPVEGEETAAVAAGARRNANKSPLKELVILGESADCPDPTLRGVDGHYHTGDLFQEVMPGRFVFRGRNDDWIKSENSLKCDTKSIEDNVRSMCGDIVEDCVVVGTGRPSPTLFVEPSVGWNEEKLKREILRRTRAFHARRYLHERIVQARYIVVVSSKTLPRTATKGNIRRKAVEEAFRSTLDRVYGVQV